MSKIPSPSGVAEGTSPRKYRSERRLTRAMKAKLASGHLESEMEPSKIPSPNSVPCGTPKRTYRPTGQLENVLKTLQDCQDEEEEINFNWQEGAGDAQSSKNKLKNADGRQKSWIIWKLLWRIIAVAFWCWMALMIMQICYPELEVPFEQQRQWLRSRTEQFYLQEIAKYFPVQEKSEALNNVDIATELETPLDEPVIAEQSLADEIDSRDSQVDFMQSKYLDALKWVEQLAQTARLTAEDSAQTISDWWSRKVMPVFK